jgi:hypothetical protein
MNPALDRVLIEQERERLSAEVFDAQYGGKFVGVDPFPCDTCGGPDPKAPGVVLLEEGEELASCAECDGWVDARGRTMVRRESSGLPSVMLITLVPRGECRVRLAQDVGDGGRKRVQVRAVAGDSFVV